MLKTFVRGREAGYRLVRRAVRDENGVVSFEYVAVAFCLVATVVAVFGSGTGGTIGTALTNAIKAIVAQLPS